MKITPVKGTNDYLPAQAELRDYLQRKICETYENCGFQRIFTPILEDIENLDKSEGGENLNPNRPDEQHSLGVQKRFDWGLCGGPGLEIRTGIGSFLVEGRYYYALGDIFNSRKGDPFPKSSNQVISAKVTYLLPNLLRK